MAERLLGRHRAAAGGLPDLLEGRLPGARWPSFTNWTRGSGADTTTERLSLRGGDPCHPDDGVNRKRPMIIERARRGAGT